jgi:hypothetical protein
MKEILPFVVCVMPYNIKFFTNSGNLAKSIVLAENETSAAKLIKSEYGDSVIIESIELIRLQENKVLLTKYL